MSDTYVNGVPGVLLKSSGGGTYFVPHSDLAQYRLAEEAAAVVPESLAGGDDHGTDVGNGVTRITAHEVPLLHHEASGAAGLPMPEGSSAAIPMPESPGAGLPMPEAMASQDAFPMPESSDSVASLPMPEAQAASLPMPESDSVTRPAPEPAAPSLPMPESGASD